MDWVTILPTHYDPYTEHTRSRNMEATFTGNHENYRFPQF